MNSQWQNILLLFKRILPLWVIYFGLRIAFYLFNQDAFSEMNGTILHNVFIQGFRYDIAAIFYVNIIFILFHLIPFQFTDNPKFQTGLKLFFFLSNAFFLNFEFTDLEFYKFNFSRSSFSLSELGGDIINVLPAILKDYYYLPIAGFSILILYWIIYPKKKHQNQSVKTNWKPVIITFVLFVPIWILGIRGGWQLQPLKPNTANIYLPNGYSILANNTTFNMIYSLRKKQLEVPAYFPAEELNDRIDLKKNYYQNDFNRIFPETKNVVIIVLESFAEEFVGYANVVEQVRFTPFIDSLACHSITIQNGYANGKRSIQGIASVLSGLPNLMPEPFIVSSYQQNQVEGLASILKPFGYSSAFFHGGKNGTMSFDKFTNQTGIEQYFGMNEYPNKDDFDGNWGIFDRPYFEYTAKEISKLPQPFFATLFSINAHHPFTVEEEYTKEFYGSDYQIAMQYTDLALRKFFKIVEKQDWFEETLFVITADHTGPGHHYKAYKNRWGKYRIPIMYYHPKLEQNKHLNIVSSQVDISPTIIDILDLDVDFNSFGESIFHKNEKEGEVALLYNGIYYLFTDEYYLSFDGEEKVELRPFDSRKLVLKNFTKKHPKETKKLLNKLKSIIQKHHESMIQNKLKLRE